MTTGCAPRTSVFNIVDYREVGQAQRYRATFHKAYYDVDGEGNVDIVLHRKQPGQSNPALEITQVIHLRTVWQSIPGKTVAEPTQINATVSYAIISGRIGAQFEGAGSVFIEENRAKDRMQGTLELALLKPKQLLSAGGDFFTLAELSGEFHAVRDPRRVVRIVNDTNRLFGAGLTGS